MDQSKTTQIFPYEISRRRGLKEIWPQNYEN